MDESRSSKSHEVQRVWEICDDWLQYMAQADASRLDGAFQEGSISAAWVLWSTAAEAALADAYCFAGGPALQGSCAWL